MNVETLCDAILNALGEFDRSIPPLGLYACDELVGSQKPQGFEWSRAIAPRLESLGCTSQTRRLKASAFHVPDVGSASLDIARSSKIKVRRYGSDYKLDVHTNFPQRWNDLRMETRLGELWKARGYGYEPDLRMLLFIGFDKSPDPFFKDLLSLDESMNPTRFGAVLHTCTWPDRYERNFYVRLALWAKRMSPMG